MLEVQGISISPLLGPGDIQNEQSVLQLSYQVKDNQNPEVICSW